MDDDDAIPDKPPPPDGPAAADAADDGPLTTADYHAIAQKQILNAVFTVLAEGKMEWSQIAPFLEGARDVCLGDFEETGRVRLHTTRAEGGAWVEAEEAFLGISVSDRDSGEEWLSETYWLSEIALAEQDPEQARAIVRALERSLAKINAWLADKPGGAAEPAPSPGEDSAG